MKDAAGVTKPLRLGGWRSRGVVLAVILGVLAVLTPIFLAYTSCRAEGGLGEGWAFVRTAVQAKCYLQRLLFASLLEQHPSKSSNDSNTSAHPKLSVYAAGHCIKKDTSTNAHECGEDAFAIAVSEGSPSAGRTFLGVADGVGGWTESGGDSAKISVGLLSEMQKLVATTRLSLYEVANLAFARLASQQIHRQGSTTLCSAILEHETGVLSVTNVGDSGAFLIRKGQVLFKTKPGVEGFNAPHQVGFDHAGNPYGSIAQMQKRSAVKAEAGDVLVLATDGVLDNLFEEELLEMTLALLRPIIDGTASSKMFNRASSGPALQERLATAAATLARHSWTRSKETHWRSPFGESALRHGYLFAGG